MKTRSVRVPILYYHRVDEGLHPTKGVSPSAFAEQMRWLSIRGYQTISFRELAAFFDEQGVLPPKPVMVTFDDGYLDNYRVAAPILKQNGLTATIFLVSDFIGERSSWISDPDQVVPLMNRDQVRELHKEGFSFGSHTCRHSCLVRVPPESAREEIFRSKQDIENVLQAEVDGFCYPYGDYDESSVEMVRDAGYKAARVVHTDNRHAKKDLFTLHCVKVNGAIKLLKFAYYLTEWYHLESWRERRRKGCAS
ncbi:MAG: polysaccharide deacetylase family protein [Deltaproteobacteria bacterium]|nr:polysaccharide deacetylase family protein [Deltaproteobacteria bacterium]